MAVILCGWGVKAGTARLQVKLCVAIAERFRKCNWYLKTLYKCPDLLTVRHVNVRRGCMVLLPKDAAESCSVLTLNVSSSQNQPVE